MSITKLLMHKGGNPEKTRIIVLAPTRVAAVTISGTTTPSGLRVNVRSKMFPLKQRASFS